MSNFCNKIKTELNLPYLFFISFLGNDPHNHKVMEMFTDFREGRLIAPLGGEITKEHSVGDCAKQCADLLNTKCMSFNYDFNDGTCELLEGIEGHHFKLAQYGMFLHYERLGIGHILSFDYNNLWLTHNKTHYFNFRIINDLGFESIISTPGIMLDTTPPETGEMSIIIKSLGFESIISTRSVMVYTTHSKTGELSLKRGSINKI